MDPKKLLPLVGLLAACVPEPRERTPTPPRPPTTEVMKDAGVDPDSGAPDMGVVLQDAGAAEDAGSTVDMGVGPMNDAGAEPTGLPILGHGAHTIDAVTVVTVGTAADGHDAPSDLEINPDTGELWVLNKGDHSVWIVTNPGESNQSARWVWDQAGGHFMASPSALAFGASGTMATSHDVIGPTQPGDPEDFMGPTLWTTGNLFDAGHGGHLDMLHNSPYGMGIAWERDNVYWVFDGYHDSITRYDFATDHGPGGADHSDADVGRHVEGEVSRTPGVPSHMAFDATAGLLYVADTGNNRVAVLDAATGSRSGTIGPNYDGSDQYRVDGAVLSTLIDGAPNGLVRPSGLELHDGILYVTDNATSTIYGFATDGTLVDWLETGLPEGALMGIAFDGEGRMYVVDAVGNGISRIEAR